MVGFFVNTCWPQAAGHPRTNTSIVDDYPPDVNPQYFPKGIFGPPVHGWDQTDFAARWYSNHLRAMREPPLSKTSTDKLLTVYRFLWLRSFHPPIAIRVSIRPDGTASLVTKMTDGAGGYKPGTLTWNQSFDIAASQVSTLRRLLEKANFSEMSTHVPPAGNDGAQWIVEGVQAGRYHVVDRWSPEGTDYANIGLYLLNLSRIPLERKEIY